MDLNEFVAEQERRKWEGMISNFNSSIKYYRALFVSVRDFDFDRVPLKFLDCLRRGVNAVGGGNVRVLVESKDILKYVLEKKVFGKASLKNLKFKVISPSCLDDFIALTTDRISIISSTDDLKRLDASYLSNGKVEGYNARTSLFFTLWYYKRVRKSYSQECCLSELMPISHANLLVIDPLNYRKLTGRYAPLNSRNY